MGCLHLRVALLNKPEIWTWLIPNSQQVRVLPVNHQTKVDQLLMISTDSLTTFSQPDAVSCYMFFQVGSNLEYIPGKWEAHLTELPARVCLIIHEVGKARVILDFLLSLQLGPGHPVLEAGGPPTGRPRRPSLRQSLRFPLKLADQVSYTPTWLQLPIFFSFLISWGFAGILQSLSVPPIRGEGARGLVGGRGRL